MCPRSIWKWQFLDGSNFDSVWMHFYTKRMSGVNRCITNISIVYVVFIDISNIYIYNPLKETSYNWLLFVLLFILMNCAYFSKHIFINVIVLPLTRGSTSSLRHQGALCMSQKPRLDGWKIINHFGALNCSCSSILRLQILYHSGIDDKLIRRYSWYLLKRMLLIRK